jgi:tripartite-type tricarboxylate transporter receptor subunit TctC
MKNHRRRYSFALFGALAATALLPVNAQAQSGKPVRFVVGFPAGGSSDTLARILAESLRGKLDGTVIIDNRAGAGGRIAAEYMKTADADGSVVLIVPNPILTIYPHVYKKLTYDPLRDLVPVMQLATYPLVIGVGSGTPADVKTVRDFLQWAKANPKQAFYGSPGPGSTPHFVGVMIAKAAGVELSHVPYKGDAPAIQDLLGGQLPMSINVPAAQLPHLASGKLRMLATTGAKRMAQFPEVPTLTESGFPGIQTSDWFGAFVPKGTPLAAIAKLQSALRDALKTKEVQEGFAKQAIDPATSDPHDFARQIRNEHEQWGGVVKASGFVAEE